MSAVAPHRRQRHASVAPGAECALGSPVPGLMQALSREPDVNIPNRQVSLNRYNCRDLSRAIFWPRFILISFTKSSKKFDLNPLHLTTIRHAIKPMGPSPLARSAPCTDEPRPSRHRQPLPWCDANRTAGGGSSLDAPRGAAYSCSAGSRPSDSTGAAIAAPWPRECRRDEDTKPQTGHHPTSRSQVFERSSRTRPRA